MKKKKVVFFIQDGVGGAERMSVLIAKNLNQDDYNVSYCLLDRDVKSSISDFIPAGAKIRKLTNRSVLLTLLSIWWLILKEHPTTVFSSVFNINNKLLLLKMMFPRIKFVIRCDNYLYTYNEKQKRLLNITYPLADRIIAQTEEMRDELVEQTKVKKEKIIVLHNPLDKNLIETKLKDQSSPYSFNGKKHLVAVGRFDRQKGFDLLADAFIMACTEMDDLELYILGDTSMNEGKVAEIVRKKVEDAGVSDLFHFCGYQSNPYPYIKFADCFILSSRWEGLPNVLIESLYLGTPAAAFKCIPIIERIVEDGLNGFLAEKEDVASLSDAMLKAVKLGRVETKYKSASIKEFTELFK